MSGNDDLFFTGDFKPVLDIDQDLPNFAPDTGNSDYLLLKQLQEEEDQKLAAGLQKIRQEKTQQQYQKRF